MAKKKKKGKPFGGVAYSFKGCDDSMEDVFGKDDLAPSEMTKVLWKYIKKNDLRSDNK